MHEKIDNIVRYVKTQIKAKDIPLFVAKLDDEIGEWSVVEGILNHFHAILDGHKEDFNDIIINPKNLLKDGQNDNLPAHQDRFKN